MENNNALKALNNLYGLLLEMNYHREPLDFMDEITDDDAFVSKHLKKITLRRSKAKALLMQNKYAKLREEFLRLKEYGFEKLQELLTPKDRIELQPLFSKFKELEGKDEIDINEDQEFLMYMSKLIGKVGKDESE